MSAPLRFFRTFPALLCLCSALLLSACGGGSSSVDPAVTPGQPQGLEVVAASTDWVELAWWNSTADAATMVERAEDLDGAPGAFVQVDQVAVGVTQHHDPGLSPATAYWYRVRAVKAGVASQPSDSVLALTAAVGTLPAAPTGLEAVALTYGMIRVSWDEHPEGVDGFQVERADDVAGAPGGFAQIAEVTSGTEHVDTAVADGATYWYRVRAYQGYHVSAYSELASATAATAPILAARTTRFPLAGEQESPHLVIFEDGRYFVSMASGNNLVLLAFAADGTLSWQREYSNLAFPNLTVRLDAAADGYLLMTYTTSGGYTPGLIYKVDTSDGSLAWARNISYNYPGALLTVFLEPLAVRGPTAPPLSALPFGPSSSAHFLGSISIDGATTSTTASLMFPSTWLGSTEPVGAQALGDGGRLLWSRENIARVDGQHAVQWERTLLGPSGLSDSPILRAAHELPDGSLLALGFRNSMLWSGIFESATGSLVTQLALHVDWLGNQQPHLAAAADGGLYVALNRVTHSPVVLRFDSSGALQWVAAIDTPQLEWIYHLVPLPDQRCLVVGATSFGDEGHWFVSLDPVGQLEWETILPSTTLPWQAPLVAMESDGTVILGGSGHGSGFETTALAASGAVTSHRRWSGLIHAVDLLPDGRWGVVGQVQSNSLWTVLLDPDLATQVGALLPTAGGTAWGSVISGLHPDGRLLQASISTPSAGSDLGRVELSLGGDGTLAQLDAGCASPFSHEELPVSYIHGVAIASDPSVDVTASFTVSSVPAQFIASYDLVIEDLPVTVFPGTTQTQEICGW